MYKVPHPINLPSLRKFRRNLLTRDELHSQFIHFICNDEELEIISTLPGFKDDLKINIPNKHYFGMIETFVFTRA